MMFTMGMISAVKMVLNIYNDRLFVDLNTSATYNQERTTLVPKLTYYLTDMNLVHCRCRRGLQIRSRSLKTKIA